MKLLVILIFLCSQICVSQIEITGKIKDIKGEAVSFANIVLKDSIDTVKKYAIADENGSFIIQVDKGTYKLEVSILGFKNWNKEVNFQNNQNLEDTILETSIEELDEVVVKNKLIERKPDRLIFNVENSIASSGGNALDALRIAPGMAIDDQGISMIGRGASRVMLNGRIIQFSGEELVGFLNSIASDDIKKIEIITNPPAKYEAAGGGGLINIIYKKGAGDFWKNSTTLALNQNTYRFYTLRNSFLYSKNKLKLSLSVNGDIGDIRAVETIDTNYPSGLWKTTLVSKEQKDNTSARFALDYDLSEKTSIGAQYLGNYRQPNMYDNTITEIFNNMGIIDSLFDNNGSNDRKITSHMYNVHFITKLDTIGKSISVDLDYLDYENDLERNYLVNTLSPENQFIGVNQAARNQSNQDVDNFSVKVDVNHPLKFIDLSYGAKMSNIKTVNNLENFNLISGDPILDPLTSDEFEYEENILAAYLNGSKKIGDKWEMQLGLRVENTTTEGFSKTLNQINKNDYTKFFPTFYVSYERNDNNNFSFNYGRRINRPSFRDLNPFRFFSNTNFYSEGNPFLQPSFIDNFEFNYIYKEVLTTSVFTNYTSDGYGYIYSADADTNTQAIILRNYYTLLSSGISESYTFKDISWWYSQNSIYLINYEAKFNGEIDAMPLNGFQFYIDTYNTFSLSESTKLQLDFFYSSPLKSGLSSYGERYGLDLGLKKSFLSNDLQVSLFAKDIFDTGSFNNIVSNANGVNTTFGLNRSRRYFRVSLSYNFGNKKIDIKGRNFGNDEEKNRTN